MEKSLNPKSLRYFTILLGVYEIIFGCMVGFIPPSAVPWFRGIIMAHIEYTANGVLVIVLGFLVREMRLGPKAFFTWFISLQLGTWLNGTSGLIAGFSGQSSRLLSSINASYPPPHGVGNDVVFIILIFSGISILVGLVLTAVGLQRKYRE